MLAALGGALLPLSLQRKATHFDEKGSPSVTCFTSLHVSYSPNMTAQCFCSRREEASAQRAEKRAALGGPLLPLNLQRQVQATRFDEEGSLNATRFMGLQGNLANSYSNALLQACLVIRALQSMPGLLLLGHSLTFVSGCEPTIVQQLNMQCCM